jgi:hypothetical protein
MSLATRRAFLQQAAAAGAAFAVPHLVPRTAFGANDQIHIAVAGIHGRGQSHIDGYSKLPGCRVTHLVDPDSRLFAERSKIVEKKFGARP